MSWNGIWLKYGQQLAELHWAVDRSVTILFYCVSQSRNNALNICHMMCSLWYVTVKNFKAYTTAVMNKSTTFRFTRESKNSRQERWSILLQFCCKFTKVSACQKLWKYEVWQSYCKNNKCIRDDTKAAAVKVETALKKIKYGEKQKKTIFNMADGILTPCNVAESWHWFRQVTAPCHVARGSGIMTVNASSGSTLQCDTWLWDNMPLNSPGGSTLQCGRSLWDDMSLNSPKRPPY